MQEPEAEYAVVQRSPDQIWGRGGDDGAVRQKVSDGLYAEFVADLADAPIRSIVRAANGDLVALAQVGTVLPGNFNNRKQNLF